MVNFYKSEDGELFVNPILENHKGLTKLTNAQFKKELAARNAPTTDQLLQQLTQSRKEQETQGVTINDIRYAGDPGNRQTLQEAITYIEDTGLAEFPSWKDSDGVFHQNNPLADVKDAARAIGARRSQLIAAEGEYAEKIIAGTLTDLSEVVWP